MCKIDPISKEEELLRPSSCTVPSFFYWRKRPPIQPLVDMDMKASMVASNTGSVRANHYHKTDYITVMFLWRNGHHHRPHGSKENLEQVVVKENQMFLALQWLNMQWFSPNNQIYYWRNLGSRDLWSRCISNTTNKS